MIAELLNELEAADLIITALAEALREAHIERTFTLRHSQRRALIARAKCSETVCGPEDAHDGKVRGIK